MSVGTSSQVWQEQSRLAASSRAVRWNATYNPVHPVEERGVDPDADKENGVARDLPGLEAVALALDHRLEEHRDHASRVFEFRRRDEPRIAADVREHDRTFLGLLRIRRETISRHRADYRRKALVRETCVVALRELPRVFATHGPGDSSRKIVCPYVDSTVKS